MNIWRGLPLLWAFALAACAAPASVDSAGAGASQVDHKMVYVIRHLHKAPGDDPPLNSEGSAAAERLGIMLANKGIAAIYATPTRRAMETAAPLAKTTGVAITAYDPRNPEALVAAIAGIEGPALVVGHSNTVPDLIERFGGRSPPQLTEQDYGTLFMVDAAGEVHELPVP